MMQNNELYERGVAMRLNQLNGHDKRIQDLESEVSAIKISLKATQKLLTDYLQNIPATHYISPEGEIYE